MMRAAKLYVSALIHNQDTPDWLWDNFGTEVHDEDELDFMNAIEKISERLAKEANPTRA